MKSEESNEEPSGKRRFQVNPGCSLEGLMLKLKLQYFTLATSCEELTHLKRP